MKPNIIIDKNIPFINGILEPVANVTYLSAAEMTNASIRNADALIIRTRTHCNAELLTGSNVKFIATATAGYDHIDDGYCKQNDIEWQSAPGCNASSVGQYIGSTLSYWAQQTGETLKGKNIGIIGVGHVGKEVEKVAKMLEINILLNDPPRVDAEHLTDFASLDAIAEQADIITFHTSLTFDGKYPSHYLGNKIFFEKCKRKPLIINAARGGIINEQALLNAFNQGIISRFVLDCWQHEPNIDRNMLQNSFLGTSHIAGYATDSKINATTQSVQNISRFFHLGLDNFKITDIEPKETIYYTPETLQKQMLENYTPKFDNDLLKNTPENFESFRSHYRIRREVNWKLK